MSGLWTVLSTIAVLVLTVGTLVLFEVTVHPSSEQRHRVANVVWVTGGLLAVAIWAWFLGPRKRRK